MARLSKEARAVLPRDSKHFLVPSKAPGPGSYPVPDAEHRGIAAGLAGMHHKPAIKAKAEKAIREHGGMAHPSASHHEFDGGHKKHTADGMRGHIGHIPAHHDSSTYHHKAGHQLGSGAHGLKHHGAKLY